MDLTFAELLTVAIAMWGAIFGTLSFTAQRKDVKRKLKVTFNFAYFVSKGDMEEEPNLQVNVLNIGLLDVDINKPYIQLYNKKKLVFLDERSEYKFPYHLKSGSACEIFVQHKAVKSVLKEHGFKGNVKVRLAVDNAIGETTYSKKLKINCDDKYVI